MISVEQCQAIVEFCRQTGIGDNTVSRLRQNYPSIHFTYCMDDDLPNNEPFMEADGFNLYLVDGRDHCLCLTRNYEVATGIVIAEIIPE